MSVLNLLNVQLFPIKGLTQSSTSLTGSTLAIYFSLASVYHMKNIFQRDDYINFKVTLLTDQNILYLGFILM